GERIFKDKAGFKEHRFIPSSSSPCHVAWNDQMAIVAFRGTNPDAPASIIADGNFLTDPWGGVGVVHRGFLAAYNAVANQLNAIEELKDKVVWFTGHSLGGA